MVVEEGDCVVKLNNKVATVTGSSRGIDRAMALAFAKEACALKRELKKELAETPMPKPKTV
jgi:NAD(P)-dependent dehydrogenase (short-subunit alcohol dehydrogenase family)